MTTFYIATRLSRAPEHNRVRDTLSRLGHAITYDWTVHGSVKQVGIERLSEVASNEMQGVARAEIVIVLLPGGAGTHTELGAAIALEKRIVVHSETAFPFQLGPQTCAFYHHPLITRVVCPLEAMHPLVEAVDQMLQRPEVMP